MMQWEKLMSPKRFGERTETGDDEIRTRFDQDYDRIIFSHPFRKLQDKTQVFPLPEHDFVHTRLTHSLEVAVVGRSLGKEVGKVIIQRHGLDSLGHSTQHFGGIVAAASLAHDLGNPPFGHSGEEGISSFFRCTDAGGAFKELVSPEEWADLTTFEGNAQGFRILNHELYRGLRLTYATLAAFTKYPKTAFAPKDKSRKSQKKFGVYISNRELYAQLAEDMGLIKIAEDQYLRHPLAFLVEAADDICYNIIDLEDGCRLGLVRLEDTVELMAEIIGEKFKRDKFNEIQSKEEKLGLLRAMTINKLIQECVSSFLDHEQDILNGDFDKALTDEIHSTPVLNQIIGLSVEKIYRSRQVLEREAAGLEVLEKLMETFCQAVYDQKFGAGSNNPRPKAVYRLLPPDYQHLLKGDLTVYQSMQLVVDFISGLTDKAAVNLYRTISGFALPS